MNQHIDINLYLLVVVYTFILKEVCSHVSNLTRRHLFHFNLHKQNT